MDEILAALGNTPLDDYIDLYTPFLHARDNRIVQNEVHDVMKQLGDGNAIYLSAMGVGNRIEENYLHDKTSFLHPGDVRQGSDRIPGEEVVEELIWKEFGDELSKDGYLKTEVALNSLK